MEKILLSFLDPSLAFSIEYYSEKALEIRHKNFISYVLLEHKKKKIASPLVTTENNSSNSKYSVL